MKRYLVFSGDNYYPSGGWNDFIRAFETLEDAMFLAKVKAKENDWVHVTDLDTMETVWEK